MSKLAHGIQIGLSWVYSNKPLLPPNAIEAGPGVYVIRKLHEGDLIPGKFVTANGKFYVSCADKEWEYQDGEVLCDTSLPSTTKCYGWHHASGGKVPKWSVVGGMTAGNDVLYIARCQINDEWVVGKIHEGHEYGHFPYGGEEKHITEYDVLVWKKE